MKAFCCWSGGKDCALALYRATKSKINVVCLLNMVSEDGRFSRTHGIQSKFLSIQAEIMDIPIIQKMASWDNYEIEFKKALLELKRRNIDTGIFGDIDLKEHRDWVERVCKETGINPILPLWDEKREELLVEFLNAGFQAVVTATNVSYLDETWLGEKINDDFIEKLKMEDNIDLCGEKGEFHTFVTSAPFFNKNINLLNTKKYLSEGHWYLEIKDYEITNKI